MNRETISDAVGGIADRHIEAGYQVRAGRRGVLWRSVAALLALALLAGGMWLLLTPKGVTVYAYAAGTDTELTEAGQSFTTGTISDDGELTGHPLMFYLTGENIEKVRFSVKNQLINFVDLTEQRDEFGFARNFTVPYGERESEYSFLVIDWNPANIISALRSGQYNTIREIPAEERSDIIVMEITMADGAKAVKAVTVELRDDGSFFAVFDDYRIGEKDDFVSRSDAEPKPREDIYSIGDIAIQVLDRDGNEMAPDAGWYDAGSIGSIRVSWSGREPESVQMFAAPTGTEVSDQLLATKEATTAENAVVFGREYVEGLDLHHVSFVVNFDSTHRLTSETLNIGDLSE